MSHDGPNNPPIENASRPTPLQIHPLRRSTSYARNACFTGHVARLKELHSGSDGSLRHVCASCPRVLERRLSAETASTGSSASIRESVSGTGVARSTDGLAAVAECAHGLQNGCVCRAHREVRLLCGNEGRVNGFCRFPNPGCEAPTQSATHHIACAIECTVRT